MGTANPEIAHIFPFAATIYFHDIIARLIPIDIPMACSGPKLSEGWWTTRYASVLERGMQSHYRETQWHLQPGLLIFDEADAMDDTSLLIPIAHYSSKTSRNSTQIQKRLRS
ncbi:hypothetical protein FPOAC1_004455 [Fusarium poae]|uniref:hypothetical protein n=1 Tax=Fusarium poae TaxID=36050 RepID=UPI001CE72D75|nr:hypothetical protein FPOAC1_004455 [Fusarium poae]KAG8671214.1 hypothetical protein FPOAC1_004455 [Fusarium poae]